MWQSQTLKWGKGNLSLQSGSGNPPTTVSYIRKGQSLSTVSFTVLNGDKENEGPVVPRCPAPDNLRCGRHPTQSRLCFLNPLGGKNIVLYSSGRETRPYAGVENHTKRRSCWEFFPNSFRFGPRTHKVTGWLSAPSSSLRVSSRKGSSVSTHQHQPNVKLQVS